MENPSPKPIKTHIQPQLNQLNQVDMLPFFESSYLGEHQSPMPSHEASAALNRPWNGYNPWEYPAETKYVTEIRPNDGTYFESEIYLTNAHCLSMDAQIVANDFKNIISSYNSFERPRRSD